MWSRIFVCGWTNGRAGQDEAQKGVSNNVDKDCKLLLLNQVVCKDANKIYVKSVLAKLALKMTPT